MASRAAAETVLLLAVALLLPLRLLSLALRPRLSAPRSAAGLFAVAALLTAICAVPDAGTRSGVAEADALRSEVEALRLKVARLESMLEENTKALNSKAVILEEDSKLIEAMERDIQLLMNGRESTKDFAVQLGFVLQHLALLCFGSAHTCSCSPSTASSSRIQSSSSLACFLMWMFQFQVPNSEGLQVRQ